MHTAQLTDTLTTLFRELAYGTAETGGFVLNRGDQGLLRALDRLSASAASESAADGATIAAHVDHLRYGISLMNRWAAGENPFTDADWSASWQRSTVTDEEWTALRQALRSEADRWLDALGLQREVHTIELNGMIGSIVHLGYHLGALRQIDPTLRGPKESE